MTRVVPRRAFPARSVTEIYPEAVRYFEGPAASAKWALIRPALVTGRRPAVRDVQWVGHVWESDSGKALVRFEGRH